LIRLVGVRGSSKCRALVARDRRHAAKLEHEPMSYLLSCVFAVVVGLAGACVGWIAGGFTPAAMTSWLAYADVPFVDTGLRLSNGREFLAGFGLIAGTLLALTIYGSHRSKRAFVACALVAILASVALISGAREAGSALGVTPFAPVVEFEIRLPAGSAMPAARNDIQLELHTDRNQLIAALGDISREGDRPIVRGSAPLVFRTTQRMIVMSVPGEPVRLFRLRMPAQPLASIDFGPWQQVDFLEDGRKPARRADVTTDYAIRYRVN
jgi:hypothetical protein